MNDIKEIIIDFKTNKKDFIYYTDEEQKEIDKQREEEEKINSLIPTKEEIEQAEFELKTISLLMELGVI